MDTSYKDVFLSDIMKEIIGLYELENPSARECELIKHLSIGRLKQLYHDLSKDSRGIIDLPVTMLFKEDTSDLQKAMVYLKYQYFYGDKE